MLLRKDTKVAQDSGTTHTKGRIAGADLPLKLQIQIMPGFSLSESLTR